MTEAREYPIEIGKPYLFQDPLTHNCCGRDYPKTDMQRVTVVDRLASRNGNCVVYTVADRFGSTFYARGSELIPVKAK